MASATAARVDIWKMQATKDEADEDDEYHD